MSEELKPCPFCGGSELFNTFDNINMTDRVNCRDCKANAVLWKWNTRATPAPHDVEGVFNAITRICSQAPDGSSLSLLLPSQRQQLTEAALSAQPTHSGEGK